jgi:hypothetical protein
VPPKSTPIRIEVAIYPLPATARHGEEIHHKVPTDCVDPQGDETGDFFSGAKNSKVTVGRCFNSFADRHFAGGSHESVGRACTWFAGSWGKKDRERAVAGAAKRFIEAGWAAAQQDSQS